MFLNFETVYKPELELEAALASAFSEFRYTSVINVATAVKYYCGNALCKSSLCESLTNLASCLLVGSDALKVLFIGVGRNEGHTCNIVDDLSRDVCIGTIYSKTGSLCCAGDLSANSLMSLETLCVTVNLLNHFNSLLSLLTGLSGLAADIFTGILDTLTEVGLRRSLGSDNSSNLSYSLLVDALNKDSCLIGTLELDTVSFLEDNGMRVTETENDLAVLLLYSVTYAYDLELLLVALGNTNDHVVEKSSGKTVKCAVLFLVIRTGNSDLITFLSDGECGAEGILQLAEGSLYGNVVAFCNGNGYACGNSNGFSTNS